MLDESQWLRVREDNLCKIIQGDRDIMPVLKLSYNALPAALKPCLSYLSIFTTYFEYYRRCIIMFWMAHGLLPSNKLSAEIDVGNQYITELIGSSLFQDAQLLLMEACHIIASYMILYMILADLAVVSCEGQQVSETVRHLVWDYKEFTHEQEFPEHLIKARKARTFITSCNHGSLSKKILEVLLSKFLLLRIIGLPKLERLADTLCSAAGSLRYLLIDQCPNLRELPSFMQHLTNHQSQAGIH
uniref:Disease resistance protein winged helix domain-containing protein n=1 Tax=Oryza rufipogon TaxID=4529 RepID=A0A0E0Q000_ORYRU